MLFKKKRSTDSMLQEVSDEKEIVYDFRRRSLFESYRAIGYRKSYDLDELLKKNREFFDRLKNAEAIDAGNADCLFNETLAVIKRALIYLDNQRVAHVDFYKRYAIRRQTDLVDFKQMLLYWENKHNKALNEYKETQALLNLYKTKTKKGEKQNEK